MARNLVNPEINGNSASVERPRGVAYDKRIGKYGARAYVGGKMKWIGTFDTVEEAAAAAEDARRQKAQAKVKAKGKNATVSIRYLRKRSLSAKQIGEMVQYNQDTGEFFWGPRPLEMCNSQEWFVWWHDVKVGTEIKGKVKNKRRSLSIASETFYAHDVAWAIVHGRWPQTPIVHLNGNTMDNRVSNLAESKVEADQ